MMTLYYASGACSLATRIVLEWIGEPYRSEKVGLHPKTDNLLAVNPAGAVPVIEEDGWILTQNAAILNYLAETYPKAGLGGATPKEHAEVHRWLGMINSDIHPAFKPLFGATEYLEDSAVINRTKEHAKQLVRDKLTLVDEQLRREQWVAGKRSIADAYLYVTLRWAKLLEIDLIGCAGLQAFMLRMERDSAVQKALAGEEA